MECYPHKAHHLHKVLREKDGERISVGEGIKTEFIFHCISYLEAIFVLWHLNWHIQKTYIHRLSSHFEHILIKIEFIFFHSISYLKAMFVLKNTQTFF